jgi:outer membrane protein assembly factor BamB
VASAASGASAEIPEQTGYAASTMATDGRRAYAIFANGDLAAFNMDGKQVWAKNVGFPKNPHGHASSLMTVEGRLIVQLDQADAEQGLSKLIAFDGGTGRVAWQRNRPVAVSWATPLLVAAPSGSQIVTLAVPWVISYAARDGAELWRAEGLNNEVTPSPVFAGGLVLATSPNEKIMAIRPDGKGDVTKSHVAWEAEDNIPDISSPVGNGELVFAVTTPGMLTCYDAKTGKKQWEQDLAMECNASPTLVDDKLYIVTTKGLTLMVEAGRAFRELGRNDLGEKVYATPAFVRGRIFVRGVEHLFCIGQTGALARVSDHGEH